jgi:hypothetical protein
MAHRRLGRLTAQLENYLPESELPGITAAYEFSARRTKVSSGAAASLHRIR